MPEIPLPLQQPKAELCARMNAYTFGTSGFMISMKCMLLFFY